jgi:dephospho-CoA kinase
VRSPIGLTGSIASGKSTFGLALASRLGAELFCADACVRSLLEDDASVAQEVRERIHSAAYTASGSPDRSLLRSIIFSDPAKKAAIEGILHPRVREAWMARAGACAREQKPFVADIPLLFEAELATLFPVIVTVACSPGIQLDRLLARSGLNEEIAKKMIASQLPTDTKIAQSHHVVWNDGSFETLNLQADFLASLFDVRSRSRSRSG